LRASLAADGIFSSSTNKKAVAPWISQYENVEATGALRDMLHLATSFSSSSNSSLLCGAIHKGTSISACEHVRRDHDLHDRAQPFTLVVVKLWKLCARFGQLRPNGLSGNRAFMSGTVVEQQSVLRIGEARGLFVAISVTCALVPDLDVYLRSATRGQILLPRRGHCS
jgi:hypothetical protein